ncbi:hypothetical protein [Streptomonospora wellingtoniae]|uniref:Uncharacterized protein n=1 Tax=Streptomonospora wellingtoniae TaxID=3075544 RepID=A0ABU2KMY0_9ACTN|nr:hypothetical protein [Streptomonospora sp. DSM 45055]MDT0300619.1 hypothetical protein [Streptomonospora sp. DSM 45055]
MDIDVYRPGDRGQAEHDLRRAATLDLGDWSEQRPSTRFKDLLDMLSVIGSQGVTADIQLDALRSEAQRRGLTLPPRFTVPDRQLWERGFAAEARRAVALLPTTTLDGAQAIAAPFLDPLLDGTAAGTWNPRTALWEPSA